VTEIQRLITGFHAFKKDYYGPARSVFYSLKEGQSPKSMIIGCSDSRVDPAILTGAAPGDIFVVRNVANLVPAYEEDGGKHGVSAALEFAVCYLKVEHIIVLGHSGCGGINALMTGASGLAGKGFITNWMSIAGPARDRVLANLPGQDLKSQQRAAEKAAIEISLENLRTFPFIKTSMRHGRLSLHGWYFDIQTGDLFGYESETGSFQDLSNDEK
jgi:carbonic anhydrase